MKARITEADILSELRRIQQRNSVKGGLTASEIAKASGMSIHNTGRLIRRAVASGTCHFVGKRPTADLTGRIQMIPVYRFTRLPAN